jgi:hypothetical protein
MCSYFAAVHLTTVSAKANGETYIVLSYAFSIAGDEGLIATVTWWGLCVETVPDAE